jgi:hypothetical protein
MRPVGLVILCVTAAAAAAGLREYPSADYVLYTDLPEAEAREATERMARTAAEYRRWTAGLVDRAPARLPFYLYNDVADYARAGGPAGSGGAFDGEKLMAVTLRRPDGVISLSTWHLVQHEGFHQFAHAAAGGRLPAWAEEGLAEYYGEALFTGDGFVTGLIPQTRLARVQRMIAAGEQKSIRDLLDLSRDAWRAKVDPRNYDQAWAIVHFLTHGDGGRWRAAFVAYLRDVAKGGDVWPAYNRHLRPVGDLETAWRAWWAELPDHPAAALYARATVDILTSFIARANARGQTFGSIDALLKTPAGEIRQAEADWLPPTLFAMAVSEAGKMRARGDSFALRDAAVIELTLKDGTRMVGRPGAGVVVEKAGASSTRASRATTQGTGELLK